MIVVYKSLLFLYNFIFYVISFFSIILLPFFKNKQKIKERLLLIKKQKSNKRYIWLHGASVGEVLSAKSLINSLLNKYKNEIQIIITSHTETSKNIIENIFENNVEHHYLPYDCKFLVKKFIKKYNPSMVIWLEQDFFPIFLKTINKNKIPLILLNARISDNSFKKWKRIKFIISQILGYFNEIYPMSIFNKQKIDFLNGKDNKFIGNLKYTNLVSKELVLENNKKGVLEITPILKNNFVFTALSIHAGEEDIILNLYNIIKQQSIKVKIVVIPRHINKINQMVSTFEKNKIKVTLYSNINNFSFVEDIIIIDSMGKTNLICLLSDLTFIGKSLYMKGGHNLLEPLSVGSPVIFGKNMNNFKDIVNDTLQNNAGIKVDTEQNLIDKVIYLLKNKEKLEELKNNTSFVQKQGKNIISDLEKEIDSCLKI